MPKRINSLAPGWGQRVREAREAAWNATTKARGFTQSEMATALGVRNTAISKWEREEVESINESSLVAMENVLGFNRAFLEQGTLPKVWEVRPSEIASMVAEAAGTEVTHTIHVRSALGMRPLIDVGDILFAARSSHKDLRPGALLVIHLHDDSIVAGRAIQQKGVGKWLLYRTEDQQDPGSYSPIPLEDGQEIDIVSLVARKP